VQLPVAGRLEVCLLKTHCSAPLGCSTKGCVTQKLQHQQKVGLDQQLKTEHALTHFQYATYRHHTSPGICTGQDEDSTAACEVAGGDMLSLSLSLMKVQQCWQALSVTEVTTYLTWIVVLWAAAWTVGSKLEKRLVDHGLRSTRGSPGSKIRLEVSQSESNSTHAKIAMLATARRSWSQCLNKHAQILAPVQRFRHCFKSHVSTPYYSQNCMLRRRSSGDILHGQLT